MGGVLSWMDVTPSRTGADLWKVGADLTGSEVPKARERRIPNGDQLLGENLTADGNRTLSVGLSACERQVPTGSPT